MHRHKWSTVALLLMVFFAFGSVGGNRQEVQKQIDKADVIWDRGAKGEAVNEYRLIYQDSLPADKMKMRQPHAVPLSQQAIAILKDMRSLSGSGHYVFPSIRTRARPISENTINAALRRMGYSKDQMTAHGFRTSASSLLNESGKWNPDAIERALAHMVAGSVRRIYNQSAYWTERVKMAQWWSDYLDELRGGGNRCMTKSRLAA